MGRVTKKYCKICGEEFDTDRMVKFCKNCLSKKKKEEMLKFYRENGGWKRKLKWRERLGYLKAKVPCEEDWNNDFVPAVTKSNCSYCGEVHYEDVVYPHPFMKWVDIFGLNLEQIEELIEEIRKEIKEGKTTNEVLEKRGLAVEGMIKEELI